MWNKTRKSYPSVCAVLASADFHMWSSVSLTFSANCSDRSLARSKHSASFSGLRRSMLIRSTADNPTMQRQWRDLSQQKKERRTARSTSELNNWLTIEVRRVTVTGARVSQRCEVGHHVLRSPKVNSWTRRQQHHKVKELEDVWARLVDWQQDQTVSPG